MDIAGEIVLDVEESLPERLATMYRKVSDQLAAAYQPGCIAWIEQNRPDIQSQIDQANQKANQVWLSCVAGSASAEQVKVALVAWYKAYRAGIVAYQEPSESESTESKIA